MNALPFKTSVRAQGDQKILTLRARCGAPDSVLTSLLVLLCLLPLRKAYRRRQRQATDRQLFSCATQVFLLHYSNLASTICAHGASIAVHNQDILLQYLILVDETNSLPTANHGEIEAKTTALQM